MIAHKTIGKVPPVIRLDELQPKLLESIKSRGLFHCGVLSPNCALKPVYQVRRTVRDSNGKKQTMYSPFCLAHAMHFAAKEGHKWPETKEA